MTDKETTVEVEASTETNFRRGKSISFVERVKYAAVSILGYWAILFIGSTLRWEIDGWDSIEAVHREGKRFIGTFWHNRIVMTAYFFRHRNMVAMISRNKDGEYIARVSRRLGFGAARGSSSRGSREAVVEMIRALRNGKNVLFTLDGPRGPRYVAKPGAVYVARKTGNPIVPFNVSVENKWIMHSWDRFIVPKPFSRALVLIGSPVDVDRDADEVEIHQIQERIQETMDNLCRRGDTYWA